VSDRGRGIEQFKRVLVLGAHPDDEMGCAGTLARLAEAGSEIDVVTFSDCRDLIPAGFTVGDLLNEWRSATQLLGIPVANLALHDIPNRNFPEHRQRILSVLDERVRIGYELVFLPASSDAHQDHATVSAEGTRAFKHATVLGYELPMNTVAASTLSCYVRLSDRHVNVKVQHASTYESQANRRYMDAYYIRGLVAVRGVQANMPAAEAFEVIRWIA
jgi:LmbE family N-acetylglucosaminyl deacetylase